MLLEIATATAATVLGLVALASAACVMAALRFRAHIYLATQPQLLSQLLIVQLVTLAAAIIASSTGAMAGGVNAPWHVLNVLTLIGTCGLQYGFVATFVLFRHETLLGPSVHTSTVANRHLLSMV